MSEESRKHDLNINGTATNCKNDVANNNSRLGGRIKFFKEGKFILEIKRTCDGDKYNWVSVTKKTYWPSPDESRSTSSLSDDNSSSISGKETTDIQPWKMFHSRKQVTPKRTTSHIMTFYFHNPRFNVLTTLKKRRRPYDGGTNDVIKVRGKKRSRRHCTQLHKVIQTLRDKLRLPRLCHGTLSPRKRSRSMNDSLKSRFGRSSPCKLIERHALEQNHTTSSHIYFRDTNYYGPKLNSYPVFDKPKKKSSPSTNLSCQNSSPIYPYAKWYSGSNHSRIGYGKHPQIYTAPEPKAVPLIWRVHTPDDDTSDFGDMPLNLSKHTI